MALSVRHQFRSPNFSSREQLPVSILLMHYTGMQSGDAALKRLCDAEAQVSAHYVVDEQGAVFQLVDEAECAWHAGVSSWRGERKVNARSVGIEIVNPGHEWGYRPFPAVQMQAVAELSVGIIARHEILPRNVIAHSDVAPLRKDDPGELFDWPFLAERGVGLWHGLKPSLNPSSFCLKPGEEGEPVAKMQVALAQYGYEVPQNGVFDITTQKVAVAFQRHFRARDISGAWDVECAAALGALLQKI